ncbi:MAG: hypothetical protein IT292_04630 [Deltaproteobacteria bacterium]|nr:hypothetical protein [Deltaproteobacteria bacterium]
MRYFIAARVSAIGLWKCRVRNGTRGMIWRLQAGRSDAPALEMPAMVCGEMDKPSLGRKFN